MHVQGLMYIFGSKFASGSTLVAATDCVTAALFYCRLDLLCLCLGSPDLYFTSRSHEEGGKVVIF